MRFLKQVHVMVKRVDAVDMRVVEAQENVVDTE
jgi:hypothetical protein